MLYVNSMTISLRFRPFPLLYKCVIVGVNEEL